MNVITKMKRFLCASNLKDFAAVPLFSLHLELDEKMYNNVLCLKASLPVLEEF